MKPKSAVKILSSGEGEAIWALGERISFKLGAEDTGGAFGLAELIAQPRNGPPPHIHLREDELFYVIEGDFGFILGDRRFTRSSGFATCLPKNVLHTYNSLGRQPGKLLVMATPCGFERFLSEWSQPVNDPAEPPPPPTPEIIAKLMTAAPAYGIEFFPDANPASDQSAPPAERSFWVCGNLVTIKLTGRETNGNFSAVEITCPPGAGVFQHLHVAMDEFFYVLEGAVEFAFGSRVEQVQAGGLVWVPRGIMHGFACAGSVPARVFDVHTPAGFEAFFEEAGMPATNLSKPPSGPAMSLDQVVALVRKHGMEVPPS